MDTVSVIIIICVISAIIALITILWLKFGTAGIESPQRRAGRMGEESAGGIIGEILYDTDVYLRNVRLMYNGEQTELDNVIINSSGVVIIEIKNWYGELFGEEDDPEWIQNKSSPGGGVSQQIVRNPVFQVRRQVRILTGLLAANGYPAGVRGFVFFVKLNSPVESEYILRTQEDIDRAIHDMDTEILSGEDFVKIQELLTEKNDT